MREGIRDFIDRCSEAGRSQKTTHFLYVNGKDQCGNSIPLKMHLQRRTIWSECGSSLGAKRRRCSFQQNMCFIYPPGNLAMLPMPISLLNLTSRILLQIKFHIMRLT